ncbi:hypothetical protein ACX0G9_27250 [Flavitalea flava]
MQQLLKHLFQADTLEEVPRERLENLIEEYPSFGVARYLLSQKLGAEKAVTFQEETLKTNLYFSNPFWLHWLLQNQPATQPRPATVLPPSLPVFKVAQEEKVQEEKVAKEEVAEAEMQETSNGIVGTALEQANEIREPEVMKEDESVAEHSFNEDEKAEELPEQSQSFPETEDSGLDGKNADEELVENLDENLNKELVEKLDEEKSNEKEPDQEYPVMSEESPNSFEKSGSSLEEPVFFLEEVITGGKADEPHTEPASGPGPETVTEYKQESVVTQQENKPSGGEIPQAPKAFNFTLSPIIDPPIDSPLVFESFHTIDYFASQGIKLRLDENPSDRLGKQVKSFTDWLKVMRRLPQKNAEIIPDIAAESKIQAIAAHSIEGKEVVTETMAEVLSKQGMKDKAIEVYRKLSLLNPGKSAYFASKIEQLKTF